MDGAGGLRSYEMKKWWEGDGDDNASDTVALIRTQSAEQRAATEQARSVAATFDTQVQGLDQQLQMVQQTIADLTAGVRVSTAAGVSLEPDPEWLPPGQPVCFPNPLRPPGRKPRLLCLHGYSQNAQTLFAKTKKLRRALEAEAQLVFVDGPFKAAKKNQATARFGDMPSATNRCFWEAIENEANGEWNYHGCEQSLLYLQRVLRDLGPIDGIIGFSQGAVLAHLLLARKVVPSTVRCVICISGFVARDVNAAAGGGIYGR